MKQILNHEESSQWLDYLCDLHSENGGGTELRVIRQPKPEHEARIKELRKKVKTGDITPEEVVELKEISVFPTIGLFKDHTSLLASLDRMISADPESYERANIYTTLNPVGDTGGRSCGAEHIQGILWLPIDLDPIRYDVDDFGVEQFLADKNLSTSDAELKNATQVSEVIRAMVETATGVAPTVVGLSGNGRHLLYRVENYGKEKVVEISSLVGEILLALSTIFKKTPLSKNLVNVDTKVYDPSRIWKLYGALSQKGENTAERPHRMSAVIELRPTAKPLTEIQLRELLKFLKEFLKSHGVKDEPAKPAPTAPTAGAPDCKPANPNAEWLSQFRGHDLLSLNLNAALHDAGLTVIKDGEIIGLEGDKKKVLFVECPNAAQHSTADGERDAVVYFPTDTKANGKRVFASFDCFHDHCLHMRGAEYFHTQLVKPEIIKAHTTFEETEDDSPPPIPECTGPALDLGGDGEFKTPEKIKIKRDSIRSMDWMMDVTTTETREVLIPGLLYRGEVMTLSAPTKVGKTFQLMHAAVAWGNGEAFLGMTATKPLRVLYIDPELFEDQAKNRLRMVAINTIKGRPMNVDYINLRYHKLMASPDPWGLMMDELEEMLGEGMMWDLIIVDSMYKFQGDTNLNDSAAVNRMLLKLKVVTGAGCQPAIIYVHHYAKGDPSVKKTTDRSAGSFAFSADADTIVTLTPHPESDKMGIPHYNVEFTLRHWAPRNTVVVARHPELPMLMPVEGVKPQIDNVHIARRNMAARMCQLVDQLITPHVSQVMTYSSITVKAKDIRDESIDKLGIDLAEFQRVLKVAVDEEWLAAEGHGAGRTYRMTESGQNIIKEISQPGEEPEDAPVDTSDDSPPWTGAESQFAGRSLV